MEQERAAMVPGTPALRWVVGALAVTMSLYHMYVAAFGPPEALIFRGTHLMFATTLVFLLYPFGRGWSWRALDAALLIGGLGLVLHIFFNYQYYTSRIIYIDELTVADKAWAVVSIAVVLEATRRVIGWALPLRSMKAPNRTNSMTYDAETPRVDPKIPSVERYTCSSSTAVCTWVLSA